MFEKTLQDLVKGIRSNKNNKSAYIAERVADMKIEMKSVDPFVKANAIRKLTYVSATRVCNYSMILLLSLSCS